MKAKQYLLCLLLLCLLQPLATTVVAQEQAQLTYSHSTPITSASAISQDRNGNLYLLDAKRNLLRLDAQGRPLDTYSPRTRGRITAIEAWNPMKIMLFYQDRQEVALLDRFLRPITSTRLSDYDYTGMVRVASISSDDNLWLFNETEFTLSKLDIQRGSKAIETSLELILDREQFDVRQLREYQNMLYMLDANAGIYVFDNLGNYKQKLPYEGINYIGFSDNELYFVKEDKLHFRNLYQQQEQVIKLPAAKQYTAALVSNEYAYLFSQKQLDVYTLKR
ncbi:hypothetical protein [Pontibacter harenae]|uniref:hypothetical protein n=1 Tax=Pontibacter harenae TaxID=2894083 RepID=UPI001E5DC834|nr:hypothetical protein [Pontibacter harenae]MCC9165995.1 hypothetical protein [Pontibacter harenae]